MHHVANVIIASSNLVARSKLERVLMEISNPLYTYKAKVLNVIDGDTIDVSVDVGFRTYREDRFRLARINAYETSLRSGTTEEQKQMGIQGATYLRDLLVGKQVIIKTTKDSTDKYGRYLAEIFLGEQNINDMMVTAGYAIYQSY